MFITRDRCSNNPCKNGSTCSVLEGAAVKCECELGFTGLFCITYISSS